MKKKAQCVLLDTKRKGALRQTTNGLGGEPVLSLDRWGNEKHLYFVSDDKIVDGDWCINKNKDTLYQKDNYPMDISWKKVVATTNPDCRYNNLQLGRIGDDFIPAYIKAYNEGSPITEVNLEYEDNGYEVDMEGVGGQDIGWMPKIELKVRPNGTVIISSVEKDSNPNNLKVGEEYWIKYLPCDSIWEHVKITRFTEQGYAWGEGSRHSGIISQDLYDIKPFSKFTPKVEKTYTHDQLSTISFISFIVGIANPQLSATELIQFHKEWFDRNYPQ